MLDLSPVFDVLATALIGLLAAAIPVALRFLAKELGIRLSRDDRAKLQDGAEWAAEFAVRKGREYGKSFETMRTDSEILQDAAGYLVKRLPKTAKSLGLETREDFADFVRPRLERLLDLKEQDEARKRVSG